MMRKEKSIVKREGRKTDGKNLDFHKGEKAEEAYKRESGL